MARKLFKDGEVVQIQYPRNTGQETGVVDADEQFGDDVAVRLDSTGEVEFVKTALITRLG